MMENTVTANANPRPIYRFISVSLGIGIVGLILLAVTLFFTYKGTATGADLATQGRHRDCITTLSAARNSVFQNVDIYKAIQLDQLSSALLNSQVGIKATDTDVASFAANQKLLDTALVEARRLQPAGTLDRLIDHGGMIDGVRYDACPG